MRSFWLAAAASLLVGWAAAAPRVPAASAQAAAQPNTRPNVVVVLVERGGKGGQVAAPIARKILNAIFFEKVAALEIGG